MNTPPYIVHDRVLNLVGRVCICSLGRPGLVVKKIRKNHGISEFWSGIGFDGKGLWMTSVDSPTVVIADSIAEYCDMILHRSFNVLYATPAVSPAHPDSTTGE